MHTKRAVKLEIDHSRADISADDDHESTTSCSDDSDDEEEEEEEDGDDSAKKVMSPEPFMPAISQTSPQSTRSGRNVKPANYNMKYHPMDAVLKPGSQPRQSAPVLKARPAVVIGKKSTGKGFRRGKQVQQIHDSSS